MAFQRMTADEVRAFLGATPPRTGKLATVRADGRPHVAPVWFALDGDDLLFTTPETSVKGRNLRRAGRAALCVDDEQPPFSFVTVEGPVTIAQDVEVVRNWATIIGGRYMGADRAEEYGARNGVPEELVVRLRPDHVSSAVGVAD